MDSIHQLFERQAELNPNAIAITFEHENISYSKLNARSNCIANALLNIGIQTQQPVILLLENGCAQIAALLAVLKASATFVCLDPCHPTKRLQEIISEVTPPIVIVDLVCAHRHSELFGQLGKAEFMILLLDAENIEAQGTGLSKRVYGQKFLETCSTTNPNINVNPSASAYIVYTSGSTGKPKGIVQSHQSFLQFITWQSQQFNIRAPQRFAQWASIAYDASYCEIFGTLCFGATLCMATASVRYNPKFLVQWLREEGVTILQFVPSFCWQMLEILKDEGQNRDYHPLPDLKYLLLAGERLPVDLANTWLYAFPNPPKLYNLYGPTESVLATYYPVTDVDPDRHSIPIGYAIDGREILILDRDGQRCPTGVSGEIYIRSQYLTMGYFQRLEETNRRFIQNPLHHDYPDPVYRTGDLGHYLADGAIEFEGRVDTLVKLRGVRVELGDIESVLRQQEDIKNCAVVVQTVQERSKLVAKVREARGKGGHQQILVAYYTAHAQIPSAELRRFVEAHLPSYMVPQQFIHLDELPLNANRKLDFKALPAPEKVRPELRDRYVAPRTVEESLVAEIWQNVLGIERVGVHDNFFELGGDSLLAMQVINRMRETLHQTISFRDLFQNQTIAKIRTLAQTLSSQGPLSRLTLHKDAQRTKYPLSVAQEGIWFLWQLEPESPYYTAQGSIHLVGSINLPILQQAWQSLLDRHVIFRTQFGMEDGKPYQIFSQNLKDDLPCIDLTHFPQPERRSTMEQMTQEKAKCAFNLEKDILLQGQLFKLSEQEYEIALTFHEIILDLWGLSIMMRDLGSLYQSVLQGKIPPLPPVDLHFSNYVVWERENICREQLQAQKEYWEQELSGELPILNLPRDYPLPASPSYRGAAQSVLLDADLSQHLKELSSQQNATLFMTLLAAFNVLLKVYSGDDDLIVGAPIANRTCAGAEDLVGFFLNMLPLRTRLDDEPSFVELIERVRVTVTGALTNAEYPFPWMLESVKAVRDINVAPVFQVMFNMLNLPQTSEQYEDLEISFSELDSGYVKYDLSLYAQEHGEQIFLQLAYMSDLFEEATIARMLQNFVVLLQSIVAHPELPISQLNSLTEVEKQHLLYDFNKTEVDFGNDLCIHQLFEQQVTQTPNATAVIFAKEQLSYQQLNHRANQLARYLRRLGVRPEVRVALHLERSFEMLVAILGVLKAGGVYIPLDPHHPSVRLEQILQDTDPHLLLLHESLDVFDRYGGQKIYLDSDWSAIAQEDCSNLPNLTTPDNLLNIVYTSGSTGNPKGVLIPINAVLNRLEWMWRAYPFQAGDITAWQKSYALVAASWECFGGLLQGIPTLIVSRQELLDPNLLWQQLVSHRVSYFLASPAVYQGILEQGELHPGEWDSLRLATTSAEPIAPVMASRWRTVFPQAPLLNLYGSSECSSNVTEYDTAQMPAGSKRVPIGKPLPNTRVYSLNQALKPVPIGAVGEMYVAGACLARGYLNLPQLTRERFVPNPYSQNSELLYRTGDLVRSRPDGNLELMGRRDFQVKIRGFRVELGEIETVLAQHPKVGKCVVKLFESDTTDKQLVAYIVLIQGQDCATSDLRHFVQQKLPDYMMPSAFVFLESLPLTPNGKVDRQALPAPDLTQPMLNPEFAAPHTPLEKQLSRIWCGLLKRKQVGVRDNFFDLGGHSLLATQAISQVRQTLHVELPLRSLFDYPTLADWAKQIDRVFQVQREKTDPIESAATEAWEEIEL